MQSICGIREKGFAAAGDRPHGRISCLSICAEIPGICCTALSGTAAAEHCSTYRRDRVQGGTGGQNFACIFVCRVLSYKS